MNSYPFVIQLIIFIGQLSVNYASDMTVCETGNNSTYTKKVLYEKRMCYFVVENATERTHELFLTNPLNRRRLEKITEEFDVDLENSSIPLYGERYGVRLWELGFNYSLHEARRVCCEHNATLLIIRDKSEMSFIKSNFNFSDFHASGLWQRKYKHTPMLKGYALGVNVDRKPFVGDDGKAISCERPDCQEWWTGSGFADYAFLDSGRKDIWEIIGFPESMRTNGTRIGNFMLSALGVICQQTKPTTKLKLCETMLGHTDNEKIDNANNDTITDSTVNSNTTARSNNTNGAVANHTTVTTIDSKKTYTTGGMESKYDCSQKECGCVILLISLVCTLILGNE